MMRKLFSFIILAVITFWFISFDVTGTNAQEGESLLMTTPAVTARPTHMSYEQQLFYGENQRLDTFLSTGTSLSSPVRGTPGDWWADVVIGQPNFAQITPNEVVGNKLFNPGGVHVDRSSVPNKVYVYDAGNSRILGFSSLGACSAGSQMGLSCTSNSDCPGSACTIDPNKAADLILGQLSPNSSTCNGDSAMQTYPNLPAPDASTLCGLRPENVSILEGGSMATMASDSQGNFYHADIFNHRVLRYNNPFTDDTVADDVWGQPDFTQQGCNEGRGYGQPDNSSLCLAPPVGQGGLQIGVAIDSSGSLWVSDIQNHRILRFPYSAALGGPAHAADLVLGQMNFSSAGWGTGSNQMLHPGSVRVDASGKVYVLDGMDGWGTHGRLMVFNPPLSNGMAASQIFNGLGEPNGLELDPDGVLWINNSDQQKILRLVNGQLQTAINGVIGHFGGFGIDRDRNVLVSGWDSQSVRVYSAPGYSWTSTFLQANEHGSFNQTGPRGMTDAAGMEVTDDQLILSDASRMLFWNNPSGLTNNYPPADGVIGQPDFFTRRRWDPIYGRMRADTHNRLWVIRATGGIPATLLAYQLPLVSGAAPVIQIESPLPLLGGGSFAWTNSVLLSGVAYQPGCDCLWLSDRDYNRVFRIRNVSSGQRVVDVVLGQKRNPITLEIGTQCNQGRDPEAGHPSFPSQDSLCHPGPLTLDRYGNLFVSDHNLETEGNWRLLEFDAAAIPLQPTTPLFAIPASRVYGRNRSFTQSNCQSNDPICGPWEPVFYPNNDMVLGFNGYLGPHFPQVYHDPLTNSLPYAALRDFYSHAYSARLDSQNNLYVLDLTRHHILIYKAGTDIPTATLTPTIISTPTSTETPIGTPSYYVNIATGNNSNSCTSIAAPCRNIQEAINKAGAGSIVYVANGRYIFSTNGTPNVVIVNKNITLSGGWSSDFAAQNGASIIDGENTNNGILVISGNVVVENFIIEKSTSSNSGAVYIVNGNFTLRKSTLRNNFATSNGAGIFLDNGVLNVVNSTISGNVANGSGGGIYAANNSNTSVTIQNSTIAYNSAPRGGGIRRTNGTFNITNTILANNSSTTSNPDCDGTIAVANFNIIENLVGCSITSGSNNFNVDPQIDNNLTGNMLVHMPLAGSPAINAGTASGCPSTDQQGTTRPQGGSCDIGAIEYLIGTSTPTDTPTATQTQTDTPTSTSSATPSRTQTNTFTPTATSASLNNPLYLSLSSNQTVGGVASADEDILKFDGTSWSLLFDGSDVGVGSSDLFGFSIVDSNTILMAFSSAVTVNGLAITPQDVVRFEADSLGTNTTGNFFIYLDGSAVGLDTTAEKIDAVSYLPLPNERVLISTTGNPTVTGVTGGRDEDVLAFNPATGTWAMYFDGSDVGLGETSGEDVDGLDVVNGKIYLSTADNFSVNGVSGADEDVFYCNSFSPGEVTTCNYSSTLYFDGSTWGLSANDVDAMNLLSAGPTPTVTPINTSGTPTTTPTHTSTGTNTATPSASATGGPSPTATFTPTFTNTPGTSDLIFTDGFESGNFSAWTSNTTDLGDLSVTTSAALKGAQGLQAVIDDVATIYLTDDSPNAEPRYRARFYFDPNSITMASGDTHYIFKAFAGTSTEVLRLEFRQFAGAYQVRVALLSDSNTWISNIWFNIMDAPHALELDWRAATAVGANNGGIAFWIDGILQLDLTGIDNDTWRIDRARLGALAGIDAGTNGTYYFDAFESSRQGYIGP